MDNGGLSSVLIWLVSVESFPGLRLRLLLPLSTSTKWIEVIFYSIQSSLFHGTLSVLLLLTYSVVNNSLSCPPVRPSVCLSVVSHVFLVFMWLSVSCLSDTSTGRPQRAHHITQARWDAWSCSLGTKQTKKWLKQGGIPLTCLVGNVILFSVAKRFKTFLLWALLNTALIFTLALCGSSLTGTKLNSSGVVEMFWALRTKM